MHRRLATWLSIVLLVGGCSVVRVSDVEFDPAQDFSGYASFDFLAGLETEVGDERIDNPLFHQGVKRAVVETLTEKGYRYAPGEEVDFRVGYLPSIQLKMVDNVRGRPTPEPYTYGSVDGYGLEAWSYSATDDFEVGTLILDVVDVEKNASVWRAAARTQIHEIPTFDEATAKVHKVVSKAFADFPPER